MANHEQKYVFTEVKAVRSTEARTITTKQKEGWELVEQEPGRLRTTLKFRRPKPEIPWRPLAALGGVLAVLAAVGITIAVLQENSSESGTPAAQPTATSQQPSAEPTPAPEPAPAPAVAAPAPPEMLTVDTSPDLAGILEVTDTCGQPIADFASTNAGRTIQFDGHIAAMNNHGNYDTRFDILVGRGDFSESNPAGPAFQFRDVNLVYDMKFTGPGVPDYISVNDRIRVTAVVDEFIGRQCLLLLEPVATEYR